MLQIDDNKIEKQYSHLKYMLISMILSLLTSGGFAKADTICFVVMVLYIFDVSNFNIRSNNRP